MNTKQMPHDNSNELLPIVDTEGNVIGQATRGECHGGSKLLHPVVHLHVINKDGGLYLQKRPEWKDVQPGRWDTAVGGHIDLGEDIESALRREASEELGISEFVYRRALTYVYESDVERELINSFVAEYDGPINPSSEVADGRFWSIPEIESCLQKGVFTPNFEHEFGLLLNHGLIK